MYIKIEASSLKCGCYTYLSLEDKQPETKTKTDASLYASRYTAGIMYKLGITIFSIDAIPLTVRAAVCVRVVRGSGILYAMHV